MYKIHIRFFVPYFLYSMSSFLHIAFFSFFCIFLSIYDYCLYSFGENVIELVE